jgi:hypothetical protein
MFFVKKNLLVFVQLAIMAIARRSWCDCTTFTLPLLATCGCLYRILSDSTTFSRRSYCDLSVFIACSKCCLPMNNKTFFLSALVSWFQRRVKAKNRRQNYVNVSNDNFIIIPNVINVVATIYI